MCDSLEEKFGAWDLYEEQWEKIAKDAIIKSYTLIDDDDDDDHQFDDEEALQLVSDTMEKMLEGFHDKLNLHNDVKDNTKAQELRTRGNQMFHPKVKRYIEAAKLYNQSISFSKKGTEERGLAYANRSLICYELRHYKECLKNIELAFASNYPERLADKLMKRKKAAEDALQNDLNNNKDTNKTKNNDGSEDLTKELELSYDAHENMPHVANCLELRESEEFGRYVATNRSLKAGDVVIIEKPFCSLLLDVQRSVRCDFCHQERLFTLIPCENCTVAMYCTEQCMNKANAQYHRYECPVIRDMWRIFTQIAVMALRTVIMAIVSFGHNIEALKKHLAELDESQVNAFAMDWKTATPTDVYNTVHVLATNEQKRDRKDLWQKLFFANIINHLLMERSVLGAVCATDLNMAQLLVKLLNIHLQTSPTNMHALYYMEYQPEEKAYDNETYASACFPLLSMLNHSCAPNLKRVTLRDGRCAVVITRPIPKGGQLYDNYGMHHCLMPSMQRRSELVVQYKFGCKCEACLNDYPLFFDLPRISYARHGLIDTSAIHAELVLHQVNLAASLKPKLQRYLNDIGLEYPRYEVCSTEELFCRCIDIIHSWTSKNEQYLKYCNP